MLLPLIGNTAAAVTCAACAAAAWLVLRSYRRQPHSSGSGRMLGWLSQRLLGTTRDDGLNGPDEEDGEDVPEEFLDPITLACMSDPVLLCGTGQIYCLDSLRGWLATGSRTCPKTNLEMRDVELVRLPSLRSRIVEWRAARGQPALPPLDPPPEVVRQAGEGVPRLLAELRSGDVYKRGLAAGAVNDLLIGWGREQETAARQQAMEAMLLDLVWLMRQGDPYGSGVAAAALSQYRRDEQVALLAAVAACPAVALLWSPHAYGQHSGARLLASLARASPGMPRVLVEAGAVRGLLQQLDLGVPFEYNRCSAASALWLLCKCEEGRLEVRRHGGVRLLKQLVLQEEEEEPEAGDWLVRYDKRDAAGCLLALRLSAAEAAEPPAVSVPQLRRYKHCSHAWLLGRVREPTEGYSEEEAAGGVPGLAVGEARDEEEQEEQEEQGGADDAADDAHDANAAQEAVGAM